MTVRLGTRGSALAVAQSTTVAAALRRVTGRPVELVEIATAGDRSDAPVVQLGVGVFVSALRDALLAKEIDCAVHSYKDLPTAAAAGLRIAAVPHREDPRDVLVSRGGRRLAELPAGARIGTGAPRRIAQLRALGSGLEPVPVRGNVDTRLRRVTDGELDAVVLARAGLSRLGRAAEATEVLDPAVMLPAPAQGALAVECRGEDDELGAAIAGLDHPSSRLAVAAERALLSTLEAGCSAPVAALAEWTQGQLSLTGAVFSPTGEAVIRLARTGPAVDDDAARRWGATLAEELLAAGAGTILQDASQSTGAAPAGGPATGPREQLGSSGS